MLENKHHVFNIGSTETVKCSKVQTKLGQNISWYYGATGVKIKSGGRIELSGLSLKIKKVQLDDAGTYECRGESSTRFFTIYVNSKFVSAPFVRQLSIIFVTTNIMQCFLFFFNIKFCSVIDAILKYILYCYIIFTTNLIILIMSDGNRAEWSTGVILQEIEITSALTPKLYDTKSYYFVFASFAPSAR